MSLYMIYFFCGVFVGALFEFLIALFVTLYDKKEAKK